MSFSFVSQFYNSFSFEQKCEMSAFFGGIPAYASRAAHFNSPDEAVLDLIFDPSGFLNLEPEFLLREELREPGLYFSVLVALALGAAATGRALRIYNGSSQMTQEIAHRIHTAFARIVWCS
jgi:AAA+ ATPase superfamily predicted ATPase